MTENSSVQFDCGYSLYERFQIHILPTLTLVAGTIISSHNLSKLAQESHFHTLVKAQDFLAVNTALFAGGAALFCIGSYMLREADKLSLERKCQLDNIQRSKPAGIISRSNRVLIESAHRMRLKESTIQSATLKEILLRVAGCGIIGLGSPFALVKGLEILSTLTK